MRLYLSVYDYALKMIHEEEDENEDEKASHPHIILSEILNRMHKVHCKPGRSGSVNESVIVCQSDGKHEPDLDFVFPDDWLGRTTADTKNRNFRFVHNRCEMTAANAALIGNSESAAFQFLGRNLALARFLRQRFQLF